MSAMPNSAQSELPGVSLPVDMSLGESTIRPIGLKNDWSPGKRWSHGKRALLVFARFLITFCIGVAAALVWQFYGDEFRERTASSFPQLDWLKPQTALVAQTAPETIPQPEPASPSPDQQQLNTMSVDLDAVRQKRRPNSQQSRADHTQNRSTCGRPRTDDTRTYQTSVCHSVSPLQEFRADTAACP